MKSCVQLKNATARHVGDGTLNFGFDEDGDGRLILVWPGEPAFEYQTLSSANVAGIAGDHGVLFDFELPDWIHVNTEKWMQSLTKTACEMEAHRRAISK